VHKGYEGVQGLKTFIIFFSAMRLCCVCVETPVHKGYEGVQGVKTFIIFFCAMRLCSVCVWRPLCIKDMRCERHQRDNFSLEKQAKKEHSLPFFVKRKLNFNMSRKV